jgi:hypothetical protein
MNTEVLTDEEVAVCAAMLERAEQHADDAERMAKSIRLLRRQDVANQLLSLVLNLHAYETARCMALGVSPPSLEHTLDKYEVISRATFAWGLANVQEERH